MMLRTPARRLTLGAAILFAVSAIVASCQHPADADTADCRIGTAYHSLLGRTPDPDGAAWWASRNLTTHHLVAGIATTGEGLARDIPDRWLPHIANEINAQCGHIDPPTGWVDAGHGVYVPQVLTAIRWCESRDDYQAANTRSTARGAYQFLTSTWRAHGHAERFGVARAHHATNAQQDAAAVATWQAHGTRPWNASRYCWGAK